MAAAIAIVASGSGLKAETQAPSVPAESPRQLFFVPGTLIPRVASGVHRDFSVACDSLVLRNAPDGQIRTRSPNYIPFFVHGEKTSGGKSWLLLSDSYAGRDGKVTGWTESKRCEVFGSRYAYAFHDTHGTVEVFQSSNDAYTIVPFAGQGERSPPSELAWVLSSEKAKGWRPLKRTDRIPFMSLGSTGSESTTATTPSLATSYAGRLAHVGAICGGPVDESLLSTLQAEADRRAAVDILFVVDETSSMKPFFAEVADCVKSVGTVTRIAKDLTPRIAVSYYTDGPAGKRTTCSKLTLATDEAVEGIVREVRAHRLVTPTEKFGRPPERMLEGVRDAIRHADFAAGSTGILIVIGDTGHEPQDPEKDALLDEVARLISEHSLVVRFVQVGSDLPGEKGEKGDAHRLFENDVFEVRSRAREKYEVPLDRVRYQKASEVTLSKELEASRREFNDIIVQQAKDMKARIAVRNTETRPGPALVESMKAREVTLTAFNEDYRQLYIPGYVWVVSPRNEGGDAPSATAMTKYMFLARQERAPFLAACESVVSDLGVGDTVDHDKAINAFASAIDNAVIRQKALEYWRSLPEGRSVGLYLSKVVGIDVRSDLFYSQRPIGVTSAAIKAKSVLSGKVVALKQAMEDPDRFWFDTYDLVP